MLGFYKCYRAYVRGKINLLTAVDPGVNPRTAGECRERAGSCFALAESYAREVILNPGTRKTGYCVFRHGGHGEKLPGQGLG